MEDIGGVGDVDDQRSDGRGVGAVAAEEGGTGVQTEIDEGVGVWDGRKGCPVSDTG